MGNSCCNNVTYSKTEEAIEETTTEKVKLI